MGDRQWFEVVLGNSENRTLLKSKYDILRYERWSAPPPPGSKPGTLPTFQSITGKWISHLYWVTDGRFVRDVHGAHAAMLNFLPHMQGNHTNCGENCPLHGQVCPTLLQQNSEYTKQLLSWFKVVSKSMTKNKLEYLLPGLYTTYSESFHHFLLWYRPKLTHFNLCNAAREKCGILDWNIQRVPFFCLGGSEGDTVEIITDYRRGWRKHALEMSLGVRDD